ncbi:hypothetical protein [Sphingomonas bisphenolicum]|uniref:Uncharacterized protein n=1 Tax=Sphingomonas bisphenolicum TaxID=296544 RepID=A0ABN5W9E9_9SPHN|nr:hypothetical protein [Sphingomonas bisphenolicum]BBF68909.1 hypothetical protein SBA_ch1_11090 [Sphingomonas bisphenolicum]
MKFKSIAENISVENGVAQIAFDLSGAPAAYIIISRPCDGNVVAEFFGEDHYVEVKDQLYGGYGQIETLLIEDTCRFRIRLRNTIPDIGADLTIMTCLPMPEAILNQLRTLERG